MNQVFAGVPFMKRFPLLLARTLLGGVLFGAFAATKGEWGDKRQRVSLGFPRFHHATITRRSGFRKSVAACLWSWLIVSVLASNVYGALGDLIKTYTFPASAFVESPTQPIIYATIPSQNAVAIINKDTLAYETAFVGSGPLNLAVTPDGLTAYIANSTSSFVAVFDTQSRMVINSLLIPEQPQDVVLGNQNRLFVLTANHIYQIDATTGASTGPSIPSTGTSAYIYGGSLEISPDGNT